MLPIRIDIGDEVLEGVLDDTTVGRSVAAVLPLTTDFRAWGDELYFDAPIDETSGGRPDSRVRVGDIALGAAGGMLCVFFGPTPSSPAEDPVSAVPVIVVGRIAEAHRLRGLKGAAQLTVALAEPATG